MLFHISEDPYELRNLAFQHPEKMKELQKKLDKWQSGLLKNSSTRASNPDSYIMGNKKSTMLDPRYKVPYKNPQTAPYPLPVKSPK